MSCFVIVDLTPINPERLGQYSAQASETLKPYQGVFLAKGETEVLHGEAPHPMKALIQFPDEDSARSWYRSDAYQALIPIRNEGMNSHFHLVPGIS